MIVNHCRIFSLASVPLCCLHVRLPVPLYPIPISENFPHSQNPSKPTRAVVDSSRTTSPPRELYNSFSSQIFLWNGYGQTGSMTRGRRAAPHTNTRTARAPGRIRKNAVIFTQLYSQSDAMYDCTVAEGSNCVPLIHSNH